MAPRFRYHHPSKAEMRKGDFAASGWGVRNRPSIDIISAVALAALSAALAAVVTAIGTMNILTDRADRAPHVPHVPDHPISPPMKKGIVSRTLRSTSLHTSVDYTDSDGDFNVVVAPGRMMSRAAPSAEKLGGGETGEASVPIPKDDLAFVMRQGSDVANRASGDPRGTADADEDGPFPMVAWLMSFPNSGTSYTLHLIREVSNTTTATNYGLEGDIKDEPSVPVHEGAESGPYLELIRTIKTSIPSRYILTKTHCTGFCAECEVANFIETPRSFQVGCLSGRRGVPRGGGEGKGVRAMRTVPVRYGSDLVKRAVHVVRNPLDNIVARFHLEHKRHKKLGNDEWPNAFPNTMEGFKRWCSDMDRNPALSQARWVDPALRDALRAAPCHAEFYRYVQWHNLAFSMARDMGIPEFVLHYEDYRDNFNETLAGLVDFLELPRVKDGPEFELGKEYRDYYTEKQRLSVANLIKEMATLDTWNNLKHYFGGTKSIQVRTG